MEERGWKFDGNPCNPNNIYELEERVLDKSNNSQRRLPRRCLWWVAEEEAKFLVKLPVSDSSGDRHRVSVFTGMEAATFKTNICKYFRDDAFHPRTFCLPEELDEFRAHLRSQKQKPSFWITKPKHEYAGRGIVAYSSRCKDFKALLAAPFAKRHIVQSYIERPLTIGGFKFHVRLYLVITSVSPPRAYINRDGHVLFSTKEFTLAPDTFGANFDHKVHLTNWHVNMQQENRARLLADKASVGLGCEWSMSDLEAYIRRHHADESVADLWRQIGHIGARLTDCMCDHSSIKRKRKLFRASPQRYFQHLGLDLMIDDQFKVLFLEANTTPGLHASPEKFWDSEVVNEGGVKCNATNRMLVHDMVRLLGLDDVELGSLQNWMRCC